jgi:hypothetical protein
VLESLNSSECEVSDDELDRELARRAGDLRANLSSSIPWSEVQKLR